MVEQERVRKRNERPPRGGRYVMYWMQASQRARRNPALQYAVEKADSLGLPLLAVLGLSASFPEANARHYTFMLEGLAETSRELAGHGIHLVVRASEPVDLVAELAAGAALVVVDAGYLRIQRRWRALAAEHCRAPMVEVEGDVVVPSALVSEKEEWAARTIRPRIRRHLDRFLICPEDRWPKRDSMDFAGMGETLETSDPAAARERVGGGLARYHTQRSDPSLGVESNLSPYLHFGQVSPVDVACAARDARGVPGEARDAFLEELIVRRELSVNFCLHNQGYDAWSGLPEWARSTLEAHSGDPRPVVYAARQLEDAGTHDEEWNAAMRELVLRGKMHNYMRMYWGKNILEWSRAPREAFELALALNNRYSLEGRDPNSFAGVAWCFGKHDQAWKERPIFGKVRFMSLEGLRRKFDMDGYLRLVRGLAPAPC